MSESLSHTKDLNTAKRSLPSPNLRSFKQKVGQVFPGKTLPNTNTSSQFLSKNFINISVTDLLRQRKEKPERKCGSKRQDLSYTCESFSLLDEHIVMSKSVLDTENVKLQECVIHLNNINQPSEYTKGLTPYFDIDSIQPFDVDESMHTFKPDNIQLEKNNFEDKLFDTILGETNQNKKTNLDLEIEILPDKNINITSHIKSPIEDFEINDLSGDPTQILLDDNKGNTHSSLQITYSNKEHNNSFPECVKKKRKKRIRRRSLSSELVHEDPLNSFQRQLRPKNNLSCFKQSQMDDSMEFSFPVKLEIKLESDSADSNSHDALTTLDQTLVSVFEDKKPSKMSIDKILYKVKSPPLSPPISLVGHFDDLDDLPLIAFKTSNLSGVSVSVDNTSHTEERQIEPERKLYRLGDLVWSKLNKYPYWPAVICQDPETKVFIKDSQMKNSKRNHQLYHVRFFGDSGRRCWIKEQFIMLYSSKKDLEIIVNKLKSEGKRLRIIKQYLVQGRSSMTEKWKTAVEEIESLKDKTFEEIIQYLLDSAQNRRKRKLSGTLDESEIQLRENNTKRKKNSSSKEDSKEDITLEEPSTSTSYKISKSNLEPIPQGTLESGGVEENSTININLEEPSTSTSYKISKSDLIPTPQETPKSDGVEENSTINISSEEPNKISKSNLKPTPQGSPKSGGVEESSTINNAVNPYVYSFKDQLSLHKKNALFNGLSRVKVCDFCFKTGNLYKCKGRCGGFYHLDCASKLPQPRNQTNKSVELFAKSSSKDNSPQTRSQTRCQFLTTESRHDTDRPLDMPDDANSSSCVDASYLEQQIDTSMQEMMKHFGINGTNYWDLDSSSGSDENSSNNCVTSVTLLSTDLEDNTDGEEPGLDDSEISMISENVKVEHITGDIVIYRNIDEETDNMMCSFCRMEKDPPCYSCGLEVTEKGETDRRKCCQQRCSRYYHVSCLKAWSQTQWPGVKWSKNQQPEDLFCCPVHTCHTCFAEALGDSAASCPRVPGDKLAKCVLCPAAFHASIYCIPAGSEILGGSQILCPRHREPPIEPINTYWCFICSVGGNLLCCETCPTSIHIECQPVKYTDDDKYICDDCESGRFPLYDEIVWVKSFQCRWWPAIILFPNEVPKNMSLKCHRGDFVVRFFGTNKYHCVNKARTFLFAEGDDAGSPQGTPKLKNKVDELYDKAIEDAAAAYGLKLEFKSRREAELINTVKPPSYIKICKSKRVGNAKDAELDLSNNTPCDCDPNKPHPCGIDSNCINRHLLTECDPELCLAGEKCENQCFQKREYPSMAHYKTQGRGWGLKTLVPIQEGQFIIEYVGEIISTEEYQRRMKNMIENKEENYYFMTLDGDSMIDAGPKGNLSRFMNHCCDPNCITRKWTVKGETRVGLFAKCDIEIGAELTFNYNWVGQDKKVCKCGASNCTGFIGVKVKPENTPAMSTEPRKYRKSPKKTTVSLPPCFKCGKINSDIMCNNKICDKGYHLNCLDVTLTETSKFNCPRHNCNICTHRTTRYCVKCTNSFCPGHSDGNIRYDQFLGFVCKLHDLGESSTAKLSSSKILKEIPKQAPSEPDNLKTIDKNIISSARRKKRIKRLMKDAEKTKSKTSKNTLPKRNESVSEEEQAPLRPRYSSSLKRKFLKKKAQRLLKQIGSEASIVPDTSVAPKSCVDEKTETRTLKPVKTQKSKLDSIKEETILASTTSDEDSIDQSLVVDNKDKENQFMDDDDEISLDNRIEKLLKSIKISEQKKMNE